MKVRELGDGEKLEGAPQTLRKGDSSYYLEPTAATALSPQLPHGLCSETSGLRERNGIPELW